jgi:7-carboxy-7-deazaguanine synthase
LADLEPTIRVSSISSWVSGEGPLLGLPSTCIRVGANGSHQFENLTATDILARIQGNPTPYCIVLGGNIASQPLDSFIKQAQSVGYRVACLSSGSTPLDWFPNLDELVLSPPPPSAAEKPDFPLLAESIRLAFTGDTDTEISLYIRISDEADYQFARGVADEHPSVPMWLGADGSVRIDGSGWPDRMRWLAGRVVEDRWWQARVVPHIESLAGNPEETYHDGGKSARS